MFEEKQEAFNRFADADQVRSVMNESFLEETKKLCQVIAEQLSNIKIALSEIKFDDVEGTVDMLNRYYFNSNVVLFNPSSAGIFTVFRLLEGRVLH